MKPREPRKTVMITARMKDDDGWRDVAIRNMSSHGVMLQLPDPPKRGSYVEIRRDTVVIVGRVMWSGMGHCGLRTHEALTLPTMGQLEATRPGSQPSDPTSFERRKRDRSPEEIAENAMAASRRMQFAILGTACATAVSALAFVAFRWLSVPAEAISAALG